ncbi:MAG: 30S ribosomal protein S18 [Anaerolineae bacterium]|nr:30S ribosomal protein S18 [Anaerolineae bacterium]MDW8099971.1 30S ribosomal protein S18 [Anaerolineae bacterium]
MEERDDYLDDTDEDLDLEEEETEEAASGDAQSQGTHVSVRRLGRQQRVCAFCAEHVKYVDYKQVDVLSRYITERGQLRPRRKTGICAKHQRRVAVAVKRARHLALLPFTGEQVRIISRRQGAA